MTASKGRVLVVEDSPMQRELVAGLLRDEGYDVAEAADGRAGLELAARHQPEVIFSDIQMPEMNGIEMCRALKSSEATRAIPLVFLSSLDNLDDVVRGVEAGASDYLSKSADSDDKILAVLAELLARRRDGGAPRVHAPAPPRDLPVSYFEKSHMGLVVAGLARQPLYLNPAGRRAIAGDDVSPLDAARFDRFLSAVASRCTERAGALFTSLEWEGRRLQARVDAAFNDKHEIFALVILVGTASS